MRRFAIACLIAVQCLAAAGRGQAIVRGLQFIYTTSRDPAAFRDYGEDFLWCFNAIARSSRDSNLRRRAAEWGRERALEWRRLNPRVPAGADADSLVTLAFGSYAADELGIRDDALRTAIGQALARFTPADILGFDPERTPPKDYDQWCDALITASTGESYRLILGAPLRSITQWTSRMRPYPPPSEESFYDAIYAVTHLVYALNEYSLWRLPRRPLRREVNYLKSSIRPMIARRDAETLGELLDTLKSFGFGDAHPLIREGVRYLLSSQNADGSWGDPRETDVYTRYHTTWTAIDGLRDYDWNGLRRIDYPLQPLIRTAPRP